MVVGNEKWGGSGIWLLIEYGTGPWWSMSVYFLWASRLFFNVFPFCVCKASSTIIFLIIRQYYWRTDAPCANNNGRPNRKKNGAQCLVSNAYWQRGTSMCQYIGAPMPPAPLLLADRWFHTQSRQSAKLFSSRRNWDFPNPSPTGKNGPPLVPGGSCTLACERGGGRVPIPCNEGI